ncbi:hypothetical protein RhiirA5_501769 [Rhizophagus irregularis]|uniref:Uncharacterized protein n=2 Tax=Rhizophagus irregularis TaxID=588596 RepID=A0A2N0PGE7_9GLOM|nr:hypothetical protein RhiirA5_501769 [Rhizophagus irregularis]
MPQRFRNWDFIRGNQKFLITEITDFSSFLGLSSDAWKFGGFFSLSGHGIHSFVTPWMDANFDGQFLRTLADACHLNCDSDNRSEEQLIQARVKRGHPASNSDKNSQILYGQNNLKLSYLENSLGESLRPKFTNMREKI